MFKPFEGILSGLGALLGTCGHSHNRELGGLETHFEGHYVRPRPREVQYLISLYLLSMYGLYEINLLFSNFAINFCQITTDWALLNSK